MTHRLQNTKNSIIKAIFESKILLFTVIQVVVISKVMKTLLGRLTKSKSQTFTSNIMKWRDEGLDPQKLKIEPN